MRDRKATNAKLSGAALLAILMLAPGCGSAPTTSTGGTTAPRSNEGAAKVGSHDPCTPRRAEGPVEDPPRRRGEGEPVPIEIGETEVTLEVERTALPGSIPIRFGERRPFEAPQGAMLVAVTYRLANRGPDEVKPSENLNAQLLLRASGAQYPYAAELPCGIPITASWALDEGGENPAHRLAPGDRAKTAVAFIVPRQESGTSLSLVVPDQVGIALRPIP
jgi:hypothetical protein